MQSYGGSSILQFSLSFREAARLQMMDLFRLGTTLCTLEEVLTESFRVASET